MTRVQELYPDNKIILREVGLRDGLQLVKAFPSTEAKQRWIRDEYAAGVRHFEVGSFLPAKTFPQFADLLRPGITNGVGDRDHVDAGLEQFFRQPQHFRRIHGTHDRAAQRHRDRGVHHRLVRAGVAQITKPLDVGNG